ncbi:VOC family protein [Spongiimicrobium salis]|uniref:VOC family protein n=1 Tax=Spongiimicrobium salis TaxID=1667022 RepID=UPI00374CB7DE
MKKLIAASLFIYTLTLPAQSFNFKYDHFSMVVDDVDRSAAFYGEVLNLKETPHPDNSPGFRWFIVNGNSQIHLIQKEFTPFEKNKSMHLCLATENLDAFIAHLKKKGVVFYDWPGKKNSITNRSDGVKQIYIQDPDGYWVEVNDAQH